MSDRALKKFHRVQDLFTRGKEIVIGEGENAIVLWVAHLNAFDRSEMQKDGQAARAKKLHLMREGDDELVVLQQSLEELDDEQKISALVNQQNAEHYLRALDDIKADTEWRDKLQVLERGDTLLRDQVDIDDEEVKRLGELNREYMADLQKRLDKFDAEYRQEMEALTEEELNEKYTEVYLSVLGRTAYMEEAQISEIFFALRDCNSPVDPFDHSDCDHTVRFCPTRADVRRLPDEVMVAIRGALEDLSVPARDAGNSAAPQSSSGSSERQDEAEESTPSTRKKASPKRRTN